MFKPTRTNIRFCSRSSKKGDKYSWLQKFFLLKSCKVDAWRLTKVGIELFIFFAGSRVKSMLDATSGRVAVGGNMDEKANFISPTLLSDVTPTDAIMKDEVRESCIIIIIIPSLTHVRRGKFFTQGCFLPFFSPSAAKILWTQFAGHLASDFDQIWYIVFAHFNFSTSLELEKSCEHCTRSRSQVGFKCLCYSLQILLPLYNGRFSNDFDQICYTVNHTIV